MALGMNYDCDGSSAYDSDIPKILKGVGYSSATYGNFNIEILKNQLRSKLPVILSGSRGTGLGAIGIAWKGHSWVCDGFMSSTSCTYSTLLLHMNWGWGGGINYPYNGWYGSFWHPDGTDYNYDFNHKMVYNIKP